MKKLKLLTCFLLIILQFAAVRSLFVFADNAVHDDKKTIRVVMDDNYPPYSFRSSSGELQGITVDQWKLFEKKTGLKVELSGMEWNKAFQAMKDGKFDVVDTISYNEEREKILDYTNPYATIDVPIFFSKNISGISGVDSLRGFTVGAKKSDNAVNELKRFGIKDIKVYDSAEEVIKAAKNQEIVIFVMGKPPAMYFMYKMGIQDKFNYSTSLYTSHFYRAVKEGNKQLLDTINQGFSMISEKEYKDIDKKWFGNTNQLIYSTVIFKYILIVTIVIALIVLLLIVWNRTLHSRVRQKTAELSSAVDKLQSSETRIRALLEAIPDIFFLLDSNGLIFDYHAVQESKLYVPPGQFLGKCLDEIFPENLYSTFMEAMKKAFATKMMQTIEYCLDINGTVYDFEARMVSCGNEMTIAIVRDITDRKKSEEKLLDISIHDTLTGVYNRYYFEKEISRLQSSDKTSLFVGMFDLDGLKLINDTMGHTIGDEYLVETARIITASFPKDSIIARIGGDEFSIILLNKSEADIHQYIKRFNEETASFNKESSVIQKSISFGYVLSENTDSDIYGMIREADNRMYRVKLHRRQSMKSELVQTMKNLLEARDFITEGHANRMEELAVRLAVEIGLPEKDIADIKLLAQFHDIGKVGIPDHILFKAGGLTTEEYEIMKRHTEIGHRIAQSSIDLLPIADFILKHHEFWNGKGYPFGLKDQEIPLECRILAIVDAYDAMTNDRPYRKAMSKEMALSELKRCAGTQFDPILVERFINMIKAFYE